MNEPQDILLSYLEDTGENLSVLATRIGRSPSTLTRALSGERNPSVDLARDVEKGTNGRVSAGQFLAICLEARVRATAPEAIAS
jgi:antitoxin HigA-1